MAYMFSLFMQRSLTGFANLEEVEYLEMRVDTRENSLGNFGKLYIKHPTNKKKPTLLMIKKDQEFTTHQTYITVGLSTSVFVFVGFQKLFFIVVGEQ